MPAEATPNTGEEPGRLPSRVVAFTQGFVLLVGVALVILTASSERWSLAPLAVIATLTVISDLTSVEAPSTKLKLSGSFLGIMLAAVLLGGGPAAVVGVLSIAIGWLRWRESPHYLRNNLVAFLWFPLIAGAALVIFTASSERWSLAPLAVIATLTVISDLTSVEAPSTKL